MSVNIGDLFDSQWRTETEYLCEIPSFRNATAPDDQVNKRLVGIRNYLSTLAEQANANTTNLKLRLFQWCTDGTTSTTDPTDAQCIASSSWVFGFRFGSETPTAKYSIICHLDTVPAVQNDDWDPFTPLLLPNVEYPDGNVPFQDFLRARGSIDDKGPASSAFLVTRALAKNYDTNPVMDGVQFELLFDTSEESDMSYTKFLLDQPDAVATFGIVLDAFWNVRAEKGGEGPVFASALTPNPEQGLYISSLQTTPENSTNTIADWAEAKIMGDSDALESFRASVKEIYSGSFEGQDYCPAELLVDHDSSDPDVVVLRTLVSGAQHGSAPEQNREIGANPLVSLSYFLAVLTEEGTIGVNGYASLSMFNKWMFGTQVFGETHAPLYAHDEIFSEGNGTTYAITKMDEHDGEVHMHIDIRYAIPHHTLDWFPDGTEGQLPGNKSRFEGIFTDLVNEYNKTTQGGKITFETLTRFSPDIRYPDTNENFLAVERAFEQVIGYSAPRFAIGGGTDAKGITNLLAVGPLFSPNMGSPINYHGIGEAAPIADMRNSTLILMATFDNIFSEGSRGRMTIEKIRERTLQQIRDLLKAGRVFACEC